MKDLRKIKLPRDFETEIPLRVLGITEKQRQHYYMPLLFDKEQEGYCIADCVSWEHISVSAPSRHLTYEELVMAKGYFWENNEIALQIHPKEKNINENVLHLYRSKHVTEQAESRLRRKIEEVYLEAKKYYAPGTKKRRILQRDPKVLAIYGANQWSTFEEIEILRKLHWKEDEKVVQFYISKEIDLNDEHIILLWDAESFDLPDEWLI